MYEVEIVERKVKKVVGLLLRTTFVENRQAEEIPPFFHKNMEEGTLEDVPNRINQNQICAMVKKPDSPEFDYYMGVEVSRFGDVPDGMVSLVIPESRFACAPFVKTGNPDALKVLGYLTESWLPQNGLSINPDVPLFIHYDERFIPSFKDHGYDGTQIAEMNMPVK
jgi:predicted transcriptional regulator YdeE